MLCAQGAAASTFALASTAQNGLRALLVNNLVNIGLGRGTAQKRVTGGRWRRIVLGELLAGQLVELGGSPRL